MISRNQSEPVRCGAISSFKNLEALATGFEEVIQTLPPFDASEYRQRHGDNQPPNVLNIALRVFEEEDDMSAKEWSEKIPAFVNERKAQIKARGVRRVSVMICRRGQYPEYYTLRDFNGHKEGNEKAIKVRPRTPVWSCDGSADDY